MTKDQKPSSELRRLLTPARGDALDALFREVIGEPASTQSKPLSSEKPLFLQAAETRAAARGIAVDRLLGDYSARLKTSKYPTLECLLPEDVQRISEGGILSEEHQQHISSCEPCRSLIAAVELSPARRGAMVNDVLTSPDYEPVAEGVPGARLEAAATPDTSGPNLNDLVGASEEMSAVLRRVRQFAPLDTTVLLLGETGTGKEMVARAIHALSGRRVNPLVTINCGALPSDLLDSELFGYEKGAFTGAVTSRPGLLERANGGTLFLNDVADLPLAIQPKLLRVLQDHEFQPLGSDRIVRVNVRLIASTNRNLERVVRSGTFREDLYYRISVLSLQLPPLRERLDDLPELVKYFVSKHERTLHKHIAQVSGDVMDRLRSYQWPGNVRELENVVERALVLAQGENLTLRELPDVIVQMRQPEMNEDLFEVERRHILEALSASKWRIAGSGSAADTLGMSSQVLKWRMKRLGIKTPSIKARS